jgi:hypothetical protein
VTSTNGEDFYRVLEVAPDASPEVIRAAYLALVKRHHPDRRGDVERMKQVVRAWEVLGDPTSRAAYDAERRAAEAAAVYEPTLGRPGWGEAVADPPRPAPAPAGPPSWSPPRSWGPPPWPQQQWPSPQWPPPGNSATWPYAPPGSTTYAPQRAGSSRKAVGAFITALLGLSSCGLVLGPLALLFGLRALHLTRRGGLGGRGFAITAVVLGAIETTVATIWVVAVTYH